MKILIERDELFKAAVHGMVLGLVSVVGLYNLVLMYQRHERRHLLNTLVYSGLMAYEVCQIRTHLRGVDA